MTSTPARAPVRPTKPHRRYRWDLPKADSSPSGNEGSFYGQLLSCQGAEDLLRQQDWWRGFNSPRNVLVYMAAAHLCHGDDAGGRPFYVQAVQAYGLSGLAEGSRQCNVFRSVSSVLRQAPPESFACPAGNSPSFRVSADGLTDNPLTFDVDESLPTPHPDEPADDPSATPTGGAQPSVSASPGGWTAPDGPWTDEHGSG